MNRATRQVDSSASMRMLTRSVCLRDSCQLSFITFKFRILDGGKSVVLTVENGFALIFGSLAHLVRL